MLPLQGLHYGEVNQGIRQNDTDKCNAENGQGKLSEIIKQKKS